MRRAVLVLAILGALVVTEPAFANHYFGWHWWRASTQQKVRPTFIDHSYPEHGFRGLNGPLVAALVEWRDRTVRLDAGYVDGAASILYCTSPHVDLYPEIDVCSQYDYNADYYGYFETSSIDAYEHLAGGVIVFNPVGLTAAQKRSLACHETGHAYGVAHVPNGSTCMSETTWGLIPSNLDLDEVDNHMYDAPDGHAGHDPYDVTMSLSAVYGSAAPIRPAAKSLLLHLARKQHRRAQDSPN